jgi:hypothetical protein
MGSIIALLTLVNIGRAADTTARAAEKYAECQTAYITYSDAATCPNKGICLIKNQMELLAKVSQQIPPCPPGNLNKGNLDQCGLFNPQGIYNTDGTAIAVCMIPWLVSTKRILFVRAIEGEYLPSGSRGLATIYQLITEEIGRCSSMKWMGTQWGFYIKDASGQIKWSL